MPAMNPRNKLLVIDFSVHMPFMAALRRCGLSLVDSASDAAKDDLQDVFGCVVWFYEGMRSPIRIWRLAKRLRRQGIPLIAWNRDAPHYLNRAEWRIDWYNHAKLLDIYATHTMADTRRFADAWLYLPNAADIDNYNLRGITLEELRRPEHYLYDVSFFGAMDGIRFKEMRARQEFFSALGDRLQNLGIKYVFREAEGMTIEEQVSFIQQSRINLSYGASCEYKALSASGLPERCYGIPACGGFLLCDKRSHALNDFEPGTNWAEYENIDDCVEKIKFWLSNFYDARRLAENCHKHVIENHTYDNRANTLYQAANYWHTGKRGDLIQL